MAVPKDKAELLRQARIASSLFSGVLKFLASFCVFGIFCRSMMFYVLFYRSLSIAARASVFGSATN